LSSNLDSAISMDEDEGIAVIDPKICGGCGDCLESCPVEAISMKESAPAPVNPAGGREATVSLYTARDDAGENMAWVVARYPKAGLLIVSHDAALTKSVQEICQTIDYYALKLLLENICR